MKQWLRLLFIAIIVVLLLSTACRREEEYPCVDYYKCLCGSDTICLQKAQMEIMTSSNSGDACDKAYDFYLKTGGVCVEQQPLETDASCDAGPDCS